MCSVLGREQQFLYCVFSGVDSEFCTFCAGRRSETAERIQFRASRFKFGLCTMELLHIHIHFSSPLGLYLARFFFITMC